MRGVKVRNEEGRVVGFLRLFNGSRVELSFDKRSGIILMDFKDYISRMSFREFKVFVEALKKYIKYIEDDEEGKLSV